MQKFVKEEKCCIIGWNVLGQTRNVNEITVEDIKHHIHLNPTIPSVTMPDLPVSIPFTWKSQNHLMNGFPSQPGVIPALVGAAKLGLDLTSVDFILGGSAMCMLASGCINKGESFLAQRSHLGPVVVLKSKMYMQNWMQTGFVFEHVMTGRKPYKAHSWMKFKEGGITWHIFVMPRRIPDSCRRCSALARYPFEDCRAFSDTQGAEFHRLLRFIDVRGE